MLQVHTDQQKVSQVFALITSLEHQNETMTYQKNFKQLSALF